MNPETILFNKNEYQSLSKVFLVDDNEEYSCEVVFPPFNTVKVVVAFKEDEKLGTVDWVWGTDNSQLTLNFKGWTNPIGLTAMTSRSDLATINYQNKNYRLSFRAAAQHVGGTNLVHIFFYMAAI